MNRESLDQELNSILSFWSDQAFNKETGLFYGRIDNNGLVFPDAPLGGVLYSRILWSFSAGYAYTRNPIYRERAVQAYKIFKGYFFDNQYGGFYWSVLPTGEPLDLRKQIYAQAFAIYALTEFYKIEPNEEILTEAIDLFSLIEKYSYDEKNGGYLDAFCQNWEPSVDMRLSGKDMNAPKTMNTHLHILEAYSNLYSVKKDARLKDRIIKLLAIFTDRIMNSERRSLGLFFTNSWFSLSSVQSYGHDIEASWLILEAAEKVYDDMPSRVIEVCNTLVLSSLKGVLADGSLANEHNDDRIDKERHWWVQAEAMVGFYAMFLRTKEPFYSEKMLNLWQYVQREIKDRDNGEWFWGRDVQGDVLVKEDKVGLWKCPYHNSRACLQLLNGRI